MLPPCFYTLPAQIYCTDEGETVTFARHIQPSSADADALYSSIYKVLFCASLCLNLLCLCCDFFVCAAFLRVKLVFM